MPLSTKNSAPGKGPNPFRFSLSFRERDVFEIPEEELLAMENLVRQGMEHAVKLSVPLKVDFNRGRNWSEAH